MRLIKIFFTVLLLTLTACSEQPARVTLSVDDKTYRIEFIEDYGFKIGTKPRVEKVKIVLLDITNGKLVSKEGRCKVKDDLRLRVGKKVRLIDTTYRYTNDPTIRFQPASNWEKVFCQ